MYDISGVPGLFVNKSKDHTEQDMWNGGDLCSAKNQDTSIFTFINRISYFDDKGDEV